MGTWKTRYAWILACAGTALCIEATAAPTAPGSEPKKAPTLNETMASVAQIAHELKQVEVRLHSVDKSVASIDKSLATLSAAINPEGINVIVTKASDLAYERAKRLILIVTACAAGLIVLHALLRRWILAPRGPAGSGSEGAR